MDSLSFGFEIPMAGLAIGLVVFGVGLFVGGFDAGLNPVSYAGLAIGGISVVLLVAAAASAPDDHDSAGH